MFDIIIPIYNIQIFQIRSIELFLAESLVESIIIIDNSDNGQQTLNRLIYSEKIQYISMSGNRGLSIAYNLALKHSHADYVCIADDDTLFPLDFFIRASKAISDGCADIYVPIVAQDEVIYSPCRKAWIRHHPLKTIPKTFEKNYSAINSGMIFSRRAIGNDPYDERLFLDFVDHRFVETARSNGLKFSVMSDIEIEQAFSFKLLDPIAEIRRLEIYKSDSAEFYRNSLLGRLFRFARIAYKGTSLKLRDKLSAKKT